MDREAKVFLLDLLMSAGLVAGIQYFAPQSYKFANLLVCISMVFVMAAGAAVIDRTVERGKRITLGLTIVSLVSLIIWIMAVGSVARSTPGQFSDPWRDGGELILVVLAAEFFGGLYHRQKNISKSAKAPASPN